MIEADQILDRVRSQPLFEELSEEETRRLLMQCQIALYLKGKVIFREGALGDSLMVVLQGDVSLRCEAERGVTVEVATISDGAVLGEMAVIDPAPRAAAAVATSNTVLLIMSKATLDELIASAQPAAAKLLRHILRLLARRFRTMDDRIEELFASRLADLPPPDKQTTWNIAPGE